MTADLKQLCLKLAEAAGELDRSEQWPHEQLSWCGAAGVYRWFVPREFGGWEWTEQQILDGYLELSRSCLTTAFVLTQWNAACRRIVASDNQELRQRLLPAMAAGEIFATVGISHLTTSRQHVATPVLRSKALENGGFQLDGFSPWVTGASHAELIVLGSTLDDGTQMLSVVPTVRDGIAAGPGIGLVALTSSCTDQVNLQDVFVEQSEVLAGPVENVMASRAGGGAGGLQTSTLAVGLAQGAIDYLREQSRQRSDLQPIAEKLESDARHLRHALMEMVTGENAEMTQAEMRQQANSLALRSTQAALQAAKGAGYVATHPTGRWAREAMFFLVWSCPQAVAHANLCELAQLN